jgi:RimJ/RimL family protein N-acetyltransferase
MTHYRIPVLETKRLTIRPFQLDDLQDWHRIGELCWHDGSRIHDEQAIAETRDWLQWQVLNERFKCKWWSDKAIVLKSTHQLIGMIGFVPAFAPYNKLPPLHLDEVPIDSCHMEVSIQWAIDPLHQRQGYASEAAKAMIEFMFNNGDLCIWRIIADTDFDNVASQGVMRRLGMRLARNETGQPDWLQVVGVLERT